MSRFAEASLMVSDYLTANKLIVVVMAIILYEIFVHRKLSGFLKYTLVALLLVMFPVTSVFLLAYQPGMYDNGLIWTFVPVLAVLAYAGVRFLWDMIPQMENPGKGKWFGAALAVTGVLFLLGNQGRVQRVTLEEADVRSGYGQVAECLSEDAVLWGPRELMQWVRSRNAKVTLPYGVDMWDVQAAAYDGDAYGPELMAAYEWMQEVSDFAYQMQVTTDAVLPIPEEVTDGLQDAFDIMKQAGVNVIALPYSVYERLTERIPAEYEVQEVAGYALLRG